VGRAAAAMARVVVESWFEVERRDMTAQAARAGSTISPTPIIN
jgi:hypothetical protein